MEQIKLNKSELMETIQKYGKAPISNERASFLANCWAAYSALCLIDETNDIHPREMAHHENHPYFNRQMAEDWARGMRNADGTMGPYWSMEKTKEVQKQYGINCDEIEFWAVLNSIYSDYCEALKKNNASNLETYVCLAKAWIEDRDAVPNKAAAYFTYVVEH